MTDKTNEAAAEEKPFGNAPRPGWLYDTSSGICAGPASYEQAEAFRLSGGKPIRTTYAGCPCSYTIRQRP